MKHKYALLIERNDGMLWGYFPDLPGCTTSGRTKKELIEHAREALELYLEDFVERGEPFPEAGAPEDLVLVEIEEADVHGRAPEAKSAQR